MAELTWGAFLPPIQYRVHPDPVQNRVKMAEEIFSSPQSDTKNQKLLECILTRNSKLYLGKVYTEEQLAKLNEEEVEKLFNNYEANLLGQMVKSLGKSIINSIN